MFAAKQHFDVRRSSEVVIEATEASTEALTSDAPWILCQPQQAAVRTEPVICGALMRLQLVGAALVEHGHLRRGRGAQTFTPDSARFQFVFKNPPARQGMAAAILTF